MDEKWMHELLNDLGRRLPEERLFTEAGAAELRRKLLELSPQDADSAAFETLGTGDDELSSSQRQPKRNRIRLIAFTGLALIAATAAALLLAVTNFGPHVRHSQNRSFDAVGGFSRDELFGRLRAEAPARGTERFFVGIKVADPGFARLFSLDLQDRLETAPLTTDGDESIAVLPSQAYSFGGYEVAPSAPGERSRVAHFVALVTRRRIDDKTVAEFLARRAASPSAPKVSAWLIAADLGKSFDGTAKVIDVPH